jgi:transposase
MLTERVMRLQTRTTGKIARADAEAVAIQALSFMASEPERLGRFLAVTGIGPESIRAAAATPGFLAGILDYLIANEALLLDFSAERGFDPASVVRARDALPGARRRE